MSIPNFPIMPEIFLFNMNKLLKISFLCVLAFIMYGCKEGRKLYVYTWADYIDPDLMRRFEKENSCEVVINTFDSNETMFAKLMAGATGYDIIMPTEYIMPQLLNAKLIEKLDMSRLPEAAKNLDDTFKSEWSMVYDIPYAFSCTGILWRKDKCPPDLTFENWNDMFDKRLNGRICMMNDVREVIGIALKTLGYSVNSVSEKEIAEAVSVAKTWKKASTKMDNESYRSGIPQAEFYVAMSYNSDAIQLIADGQYDLGYSVPTNGTTSSMDVFCIMKNSPNMDLAYKFIDMFYSLSNAVKNAEYNGVPMPVKGLFDALSDQYKAIPMMKMTDSLKAKCEDIKDVGKNIRLYSEAWDKIKSE